MKGTVRKKIRNQSGETLAETLVALLISALALMMLAGAISAAGRIITQSERTMQTYYQNNNAMVTGATDAGTVTVKYGTSDGTLELGTADCYKNETLSSKKVLMYVPQ